MKRVLLACLLFSCCYHAKADHISGSELIYEYVGAGNSPNTVKYKFTYRLFVGCNSASAQYLPSERVLLGIYHTGNKQYYTQLQLTYQTTIDISLNTAYVKCFTGNISACYGVGIFTGTIDLPLTTDGFTAAWIRCCRPIITNLGSYNIGITPTTIIPGTNILSNGRNSSAAFAISDTALVCANKNFKIDFSATDKDGDSLSYRFTNGTDWITQGSNFDPGPSQVLGSTPVIYQNGFSGADPTNTSPVINPVTGLVTGIAPALPGRYLFCVVVEEWRNGVKITEHTKEIPVTVGSCDFVEASLPAKIVNCTSDVVLFENSSSSSSIVSYKWIFDTLQPANFSTQPTLSYQYADTGTYTAKLIVKGTTGCLDSITTKVLIYPGLKTGFTVTGDCINYPFNFTDTSLSKGIAPVKWQWNFGESAAFLPDSYQKNPAYLFKTAGTKSVKLVVETDKGCIDSINKQIFVIDKPRFHFTFADTTICRTDTIRITETSGYTNYQWTSTSPVTNNTRNFIDVFPQQAVKYYVSASVNNCGNIDSVSVNVLPKDKVVAGKDTVVCSNDIVALNAVSAASSVLWSGDATIQAATSLNAVAFPSGTKQYVITANPGPCALSDTMFVTTVPYPFVSLPAKATVCMGEKVLLPAQIAASSFTWSPVKTLSDETLLRPYAAPSKNTSYVLTVRDTLGCPKAVSDTILVSVIPLFNVFAGNDTIVVASQPLQLNALASDTAVKQFVWSPVIGLDNPLINNPIAMLPVGVDSMRYKVTGYNGVCHAEDYITVKKYAGSSDFYIPTAFTPNGDGVNDVFRIRSAGIAKTEFIKIYNRLGQQLFSGTDAAIGWNGSFKGTLQPQGTYVFWVRGTDYAGNVIERKGTVVLIR